MAQEGVERRLAAIFAADVVGYSRLVGMDEEGTIARLKSLREELIDPTIAKHKGRIVKTTGDGLLVEFASVVDAVECAAQVQPAMAERNADIPQDQRIEFRVGINLGDIIVDGDDIHGDGVNVAARLEGLAEPGGICVSRTVRNQVRDKLAYGFEDLGEQTVKNIARPIKVFRLLLEPEAASKIIGKTRTSRPRWQLGAVAAAGIALVAVTIAAVWLRPWAPAIEPASVERMAFPLPEKPSIAVLPFDNLSGDPKQDYLGDGLTENIIAVLSTSPDLLVIARNSSFTFKGKAVKVQEVAEQFGVRYVLEGSVQREGDRLRITAQLVDAVDGRHVWTERYDRDLESLFELQDEITQKILEELQVKLTYGEQVRAYREMTADPEAYRLLMLGRAGFVAFTLEGHQDAEKLWKEALERQPEGSMANRLMGWLHWQKIILGLSKDPKKSLVVARKYAEKALSIGQQDQDTYVLLASIERSAGNHGLAVAYADRAIELAPTNGDVVSVAGAVKIAGGQPQEGLKLLKRAMRLEPYYLPWIPSVLSKGHLMLGQYDEARAIEEARLASASYNADARAAPLLRLAAISVFEGKGERARQYMEQALKIAPDANISNERRAYNDEKDRAFVERYLDALRKAGLPE